MRGHRSQSKQTKYYAFGCLLFTAFILFVYLLNREDPGTYVELSVPVKQPLPSGESNALRPALIRERASTMHLLRKDFERPEKAKEAEQIIKRCSLLTQNEQLLDAECTAVWLNRLRSTPITGVEKWWGFEDTHFGAITLNLDGMLGMFKPCSSKSEDTSKEVIASYLDQLLQWGQTAPVITRKIPVSLLESYVKSPKDFRAFNSTLECAQDGYFVGPVIGWWDSLIPIRTVHKREQPVEKLLQLRDELSHSPLPAQMQAKYHAFYLLINILRHGKDEFITKHGNLVSLDLDRSRYSSTKPITSSAVNFTWCHTCYMDRWIYDTFQAVGPKQPQTGRLGYLMKEVLSHEEIFRDIWDAKMGDALDTRVEMLLNCIDDCIYRYGEKNVLLNEPKDSMTAKELVTYFVTHSEYKDMNGKRGPSNFDFLDNL